MKNLLILFILAFSCNCMAGNNEPAHVIITAGQSNTDGRVPNDRLPDYIKTMATDTAFTTGAYKYCRIAQNRTDGKFRPFWPKSKRRAKPNTWGYDAITYYWLEQWWQEPFYVIKWAIGGTSIEPSNASDKSIHWSANPEWLANNTASQRFQEYLGEDLAVLAKHYGLDLAAFRDMERYMDENKRKIRDAIVKDKKETA